MWVMREPVVGASILLLVIASCSPAGTTTTTPPATVTVSSTTTTAVAPVHEFGSWVVHTLEGIHTEFGDLVWATDPVAGSNGIARDQQGGLVWIDADGLWWLPRGHSQPSLVVSGGVDGLFSVVSTEEGPAARVSLGRPGRVGLFDLDRGEQIADRGGWGRDPSGLEWIVGDLIAVVVEPQVVWDAEGQPAEVIEPAHLLIRRGGQVVLDLRVGGVYQAWARIHDFDGRRLIVSRFVHEPALPVETFYVIDLACPDCLRVFDAAATSAALAAGAVTPIDRVYQGEILPPIWGFPAATPLLTDLGVEGLDDGRYLMRINSFETGGSALTGDLMVWFSGEEANIAAAIDGSSEIPVPNDYYIRNADPTRLRLVVEPEVAVTSVWWQSGGGSDLSSKSIDYADLVRLFSDPPQNELANLLHDPWWVTIRDGVVVALDEQYVP